MIGGGDPFYLKFRLNRSLADFEPIDILNNYCTSIAHVLLLFLIIALWNGKRECK